MSIFKRKKGKLNVFQGLILEDSNNSTLPSDKEFNLMDNLDDFLSYENFYDEKPEIYGPLGDLDGDGRSNYHEEIYDEIDYGGLDDTEIDY